jgi:hypothetical protein
MYSAGIRTSSGVRGAGKSVVMAVTLNDKRNTCWEWVFTCAGCDLLATSKRSDALTCSPACRVRAHRSGKIKQLHAIASQLVLTNNRTGKTVPAIIQHCSAVRRLRPDLFQQIEAGRLTVYHAMPDVYRAFVKLVFDQAKGENAC